MKHRWRNGSNKKQDFCRGKLTGGPRRHASEFLFVIVARFISSVVVGRFYLLSWPLIRYKAHELDYTLSILTLIRNEDLRVLF